MKIAIIGTGVVAEALGSGWARQGHDIVFGSRDPDSKAVQELTRRVGASAATAALATASAELVLLAVPWAAAEETLAAMGNLRAKILLDCTNPLHPDNTTLLQLEAGSGGQQIAAWADGARVVKIFNTTGANNLADPSYAGDQATLLLAGDDESAKKAASRLAEALGFVPVDAGGLDQCHALEVVAALWIHLAIDQGHGREFLFGMIQKPLV